MSHEEIESTIRRAVVDAPKDTRIRRWDDPLVLICGLAVVAVVAIAAVAITVMVTK